MNRKERFHLQMAQSREDTQRKFADKYRRECSRLKNVLSVIQKAKTIEEAVALAKAALL